MGFGFGLFGEFVVKDVLLHDGATDAREGFRREALELFLVDLLLYSRIPVSRSVASTRSNVHFLSVLSFEDARKPTIPNWSCTDFFLPNSSALLASANRPIASSRAASTSSSEWTGNVAEERFGLTRFGMESSPDFKNDVGRAVNVFFKLAYAQHFPTHFVDDERGKLPDVVIAALRELVEHVEAFFEILGDHGVPPF